MICRKITSIYFFFFFKDVQTPVSCTVPTSMGGSAPFLTSHIARHFWYHTRHHNNLYVMYVLQVRCHLGCERGSPPPKHTCMRVAPPQKKKITQFVWEWCPLKPTCVRVFPPPPPRITLVWQWSPPPPQHTCERVVPSPPKHTCVRMPPPPNTATGFPGGSAAMLLLLSGRWQWCCSYWW